MSTQPIGIAMMNDESQSDKDERRAAEVDAVLQRSGVTRESVENGASTPLTVRKVEFNDPNFRADHESIERNPALAKALFDDEETVMPWEEPSFVASLKTKTEEKAATDEAHVLPPTASADEDQPFARFDQSPEPAIPQTSDWKEDFDSKLKELVPEIALSSADTSNRNGSAERVVTELIPAFGEKLKRHEPSSLTVGFPEAVDALITKAKLSESRTAEVLANFREAFMIAESWRSKAFAIVVNDETEIELISKAKDLHKIVRDERINVEKRRKTIKDPALRECQLIDGVANVYKDLLEPIEKHLLDQSEFAKRKEAHRIEALRLERVEKLRFFEADASMFPNIGQMSDEAFEVIYTGVRESYHGKKAAEKKAEEDRLERERANEAERLRLLAANEQLQKEKAESDAREAEQRRIAEEARQKQEAAEAELRKQEETRKAEEARIAAEDERKRLAPDREKLLALVETINGIELPKVDTQFEALLALVDNDLQTACSRIQRHLSGVEVVAISKGV